MKKRMIGAIAALTLVAAFVVAAPHDVARGGHGKRGRAHTRMDQKLAQELNLTEAQKEKIVEIRKTTHEENKAFFESTKATRQQLRTAREANDAAKIESLKTTLESQRAQMRQIHDVQMQKIQSVLTPEQRTKFQALEAQRPQRGKFRGLGMRGGKHGRRHDGGIGAFAEKLNLTEMQKQQIESIRKTSREQNRPLFDTAREIRRQMRAAKEANDSAKLESLESTAQSHRDQVKQLREAEMAKIAAVLTAEQRAQLDAMKAERGSKRHRRN